MTAPNLIPLEPLILTLCECDIIGADVTLSLYFYTYHIYIHIYSMATREATNAMGGEQKKQKTDGSKSISRCKS
jgi:hypothetical protein